MPIDRVISRSRDSLTDREAGESRDWITPLESRAGVDSLDMLHHQRRRVMERLAPLKALHGSFGKWDARRKHLLAAIEVRVRRRLEAAGGKVSAQQVEAEAHADPGYEAVIDEGIEQAAQYHRLQVELEEIEEKIRSREIALMAYNQELRLQR